MAILISGVTIEYLRDVTSPPHQAGNKGDRKTVGQDIHLSHAAYLARGPNPYIKIVEKPAGAKPKPPTNNDN